MDRFFQVAANFFSGSGKKKNKRQKDNSIDKDKSRSSASQNDPTVVKTQSEKEEKLKNKGKLFVGGLNYATTSKELAEYFSRFGDIIDSVVIRCPTTGKSRGFGFVTFINPSDAEKSLQTKDHVLGGRTIECRPFGAKNESRETKPKRSIEARIFLGGLPACITKEELKQFFSRYGEVADVCIPVDSETKKGKGFAFLSFKDEDAVNKCIAERFIFLKDRRVFINKAEARDTRLHAEEGIPKYDDSTPEEFPSMPEEDTQSSASGQLDLEFEQNPEFQRLLQNYFANKIACYNKMSGKEVENSTDIEGLENFLRGISVNSYGDVDQVTVSESSETDTNDDSDEDDCEDHIPYLLPKVEFAEDASKYSSGKSASKATLPFGKEKPGLKFWTQEDTEDGINKSSAPVKFTNSVGSFTCSLCKWTPPDLSCKEFLAHCKTAAHKTKLKERFSESQIQEGQLESKLCVNSERPKVIMSEVRSYPKVTGIQLEDSQRQNKTQNDKKCGKTHQTHQPLGQPTMPEPPLRQQVVEQQVQNVEKISKQNRRKKAKKERQKEQKMLNSVQESKTGVSKAKNENQKSQNVQEDMNQETEKKEMNNMNLKIYVLAKGMACIKPLSENKLSCEMCNKAIPTASDFDVLMRNVSQHLHSKKHLQKLLETEDKLKGLDSNNQKPEQSSTLENKNSKQEKVEGKNIPAKKVKNPSKNQKSLSGSKTSLVEEKAVPVPKKPEPKGKDAKSQSAMPKQEKGKTGAKKSENKDESKLKFLCLQCNFSNSNTEEFGRHLKSERHSGTSPNKPLTTKNPEFEECNFCHAFLFGSLFEINVHVSECFTKNR